MTMLFAVRKVALAVALDTAFDYLSDTGNLPEWTNAFESVNNDGSAVMQTPDDTVTVQLSIILERSNGIIDWKMVFPDGSIAQAYSRLIKLSKESCAYIFILTPPPVALALLEGALAQQEVILEKELQSLKAILEKQE
jgi:hypothetical protein